MEQQCVDRIRLVLADDNPAVLGRATGVLGSEFDVVGTAADGQSALDLARRLEPEVLILDISMPALGGIEVAEQLRQEGSPAHMVFLTIHEDPDYAYAAFAAGGLGYVLKARMASDLDRAIRLALAGRRFVSPPLELPT
jgi:DNA-binding NarL/FixJ family response regulator